MTASPRLLSGLFLYSSNLYIFYLIGLFSRDTKNNLHILVHFTFIPISLRNIKDIVSKSQFSATQHNIWLLCCISFIISVDIHSVIIVKICKKCFFYYFSSSQPNVRSKKAALNHLIFLLCYYPFDLITC